MQGGIRCVEGVVGRIDHHPLARMGQPQQFNTEFLAHAGTSAIGADHVLRLQLIQLALGIAHLQGHALGILLQIEHFMALAQRYTGVLAHLLAQCRFKQLLHEDVAHRPAIVRRARLDLGKTDASRIVVTQGHVADHVAHGQFSDADALQHSQRLVIHAHRTGIRQDAVGQFKDDAVDTVQPHVMSGRDPVRATAHDDNLGFLLLHRYSPLCCCGCRHWSYK